MVKTGKKSLVYVESNFLIILFVLFFYLHFFLQFDNQKNLSYESVQKDTVLRNIT